MGHGWPTVGNRSHTPLRHWLLGPQLLENESHAVPGAGSGAQRELMQTKGASQARPVERHGSPCPPPVVQRRAHGWPLQLVVESEQSELESHGALTPVAGRVTSLHALVLPMGLMPLQVALAI